MRHPFRRRLHQRAICSLCGRQISEGEDYWYLNGSSVCGDCFVDFAKGELAPYHQIRGREAGI